MRASDYLGKEVVTSTGESLGVVFDLVAEPIGKRGNDLHTSYRAVALLAGKRATLLRLGYKTQEVTGPYGLRWLARRSPAHRIPWEQMGSLDGERIILRADRPDLHQDKHKK